MHPPPSSIRARKQAARAEVRARIAALDPADRARQERALAEGFPGLPGFDSAAIVLLYASAFADEVATWPLIRRTLDLGKRVALPRVDRPGRRLELFEVRDLEALRLGAFGILEPGPECPEIEPAAIDWALVPGLGFDDRARRLGRGAGHYDRLLPLLRPEAPRWALALEPQWLAQVPTEPHDRPLDGVAFPSRRIERPC